MPQGLVGGLLMIFLIDFSFHFIFLYWVCWELDFVIFFICFLLAYPGLATQVVGFTC
jgi:hypothetical protein